MTDYERLVLDHYQLTNPRPTEWPAEKDQSDASDEEEGTNSRRNGVFRKSKARLSALERSASDNRSIPGSQRTGDGVDALVQRDEPDPLGSSDSVVRVLRQRGLQVQENPRLRNKYLLSSTTFSPAAFLSQVHSNASTQDLLQGLASLSRSIDQKSASLKQLVESNFERFVRAKATIDNVYREMKLQGAAPPSPSSPRAHSRHASKNSFRGSSGGQAILSASPIESKKKTALTKESEYGVSGIKGPLLDVHAKSEELWGPAMGGREKETVLQAMNSNVDRHKEIYQISANIATGIKRKDYESITEEYRKAKQFVDETRGTISGLGGSRPTDVQIHEILLAARVDADITEQIARFERDVWRKLDLTHSTSSKFIGSATTISDQHMELISFLLEINTEDNPIWVWLSGRRKYLAEKIQYFSDRSRLEIEVVRRRLATVERPPPHVIAAHMRSLSRLEKSTPKDSSDIIELWELSNTYLNNMLSSQGLLGEVAQFWQSVESFINESAQKSLPIGYNGQSRKHHVLDVKQVNELRSGTAGLLDLIRDNCFAFFADPPIEDISSMLSPLPQTPTTPASAFGTQQTPTGLLAPIIDFDPSNPPPPSPKRGEAWEKFAFWPPWSNSISAVHYLAKFLVLIGGGASDMVQLSPLGYRHNETVENLRSLVGGVRERCVAAICGAWNKDAENIKVLEDWRRSSQQTQLTQMPKTFFEFERTILGGMQKILFIPEAMSKTGSDVVVLQPAAKLTTMVKSQFVTTLYRALSGMVENAEKAVKKPDSRWIDSDDLVNPESRSDGGGIDAGAINAGDRNVRMLLTLSNLSHMRSTTIPELTAVFKSNFSTTLDEESATIRDVLSQIDTRLFDSYIKPYCNSLNQLISTSISSPEWPPTTKPAAARPYVNEALLCLVLIHTQVSTTASTLTNQILSFLLEQISLALLTAFKARRNYTFYSLMQATLDVEFISQTLSQYTTERAGNFQSQIYQEIDKGTDQEARAQLQKELQSMRGNLKKLKENCRGEFACFRKPRKEGEERRGGRSTSGSVGSGVGGGGSGGGATRSTRQASVASAGSGRGPNMM